MKSSGKFRPNVGQKDGNKFSFWATCSTLIIACLCIVWTVAAFKVVLIERERKSIHNVPKKISALNTIIQKDSSNLLLKDSTKEFKSNPVIKIVDHHKSIKPINLLKSSEWTHSRAYVPENKSKNNLRINNNKQKQESVILAPPPQLQVIVKPAHRLTWPPVRIDGTIPDEDGTEIMSLTGLKVPRFWEPVDPGSIFKIGSKVNDHETIFLMIASYRDYQCHETITSALKYADHPERLFIGAVEQGVPGDLGCAYTEKPCEEDPSQVICKYRNQISVYKMDASMATGPVTARHIGDRLYRGEYFVMQMDAHCLFVKHWDELIINQWRQTKNEMAVLSSYLTDSQGSISPEGNSNRNTRPIMCNSDFEGIMPQRYLRHGSQPEDMAVVRESPQLQPFWAAGFSFSRGHFKVLVPYDAYQPMVFQGEEISIGIRGFTYGYDFYAPRDSVVFHEYAERSQRRKKVPMFWENSPKHKGEGQKSLRRSMAIIKMSPDLEPDSWDHSEVEKYGIGKVRSLETFYKLFLIDPKERKATQLCPFVRSGIMHRKFQPFLRPDGLGIDYSKLENFDTLNAMKGVADR